MVTALGSCVKWPLVDSKWNGGMVALAMADSNETRGRHSSSLPRCDICLAAAPPLAPSRIVTLSHPTHLHFSRPNKTRIQIQTQIIRKVHSQSAADELNLHPQPPSSSPLLTIGGQRELDWWPIRSQQALLGLGYSPTFGLWQRIRLLGIAGIGELAGI